MIVDRVGEFPVVVEDEPTSLPSFRRSSNLIGKRLKQKTRKVIRKVIRKIIVNESSEMQLVVFLNIIKEPTPRGGKVRDRLEFT